MMVRSRRHCNDSDDDDIIKMTMMMMTLGFSGYHGRGLEAILGKCAARGNFIHSLNSKDSERLGVHILQDKLECISRRTIDTVLLVRQNIHNIFIGSIFALGIQRD